MENLVKFLRAQFRFFFTFVFFRKYMFRGFWLFVFFNPFETMKIIFEERRNSEETISDHCKTAIVYNK